MCLATADNNGKPSARIVLLKIFDERGFVFFTNANSDKGRDLAANPQAALCLYWDALGKQIRIEGEVEPSSVQESDDYFNSRHPQSRRGAVASQQSGQLASRDTLLAKMQQVQAEYGDTPPRPAHWHGWRIRPNRIEFWQEGAYRLHEREVFIRQDEDMWEAVLLYP